MEDVVINWRDATVYAIRLGELLQISDCDPVTEESLKELLGKLLYKDDSPNVR